MRGRRLTCVPLFLPPLLAIIPRIWGVGLGFRVWGVGLMVDGVGFLGMASLLPTRAPAAEQRGDNSKQ